MMNKVDEFMGRIEVSTEEEGKEAQEGEKGADVDKRLDRMEKRINSLILSTVARSKLRTPMPARRPSTTI